MAQMYESRLYGLREQLHPRADLGGEVTRYVHYVAANLRILRRERGLTQLELARRAGIDLRFVQRVEGAKTNPSLAFLVRFARALAVAPTDLLQEANFVPGRVGRPRVGSFVPSEEPTSGACAAESNTRSP
jgi:DNA-binding XRE family transcriptional regulator